MTLFLGSYSTETEDFILSAVVSGAAIQLHHQLATFHHFCLRNFESRNFFPVQAGRADVLVCFRCGAGFYHKGFSTAIAFS